MFHANPEETEMTVDRDEQMISIGWKIGYLALCSAIVLIFNILSQPDRGLIAGLSVAIVVLVAMLRSDARQKAWFWVAISLVGISHAFLIYIWGWSIDIKPTILVAPFAFVDFVMSLSFVFLAERLSGSRVSK